MQLKQHFTFEGLEKIVSIRASLNWGLSDNLKAAFPNTLPVKRVLFENPQIANPHWLAGFTAGEGSFKVRVYESPASKLGFKVQLIFQITQHNRDMQLIKSLISYLDCGQYNASNQTASGIFLCTKFSDNYEKIIPFFRKHNIYGVKSKDFDDWCKIAEIIKMKGHLTQEGLDQIRNIKSNMNKSSCFAAKNISTKSY